MSRKHIKNCLQKYHIFSLSAIVTAFLYACNVTKKVPDGEYLLTKNQFQYTDTKHFSGEIESNVAQKPNKKTLFVVPMGLMFYNFANPKYDTILKEYMTYPNEMRNQKLRDSLFVKYNHPEFQGRNLFWNRFFHTVGEPPVIYNDAKTKQSAKNINNKLINHGYWDSEVTYNVQKDSANKKAAVTYVITQKDPTYISEYHYNIPDSQVKAIYERNIRKTMIRRTDILDESVLVKEINRINELMRKEGYYRFNEDNQDIYFVADTLNSRKQVPLIMNVQREDKKPYKKSTFGKIEIAVADNLNDVPNLPLKDSLRGINIYRKDSAYTKNSLWLPIVFKPGDIYDQDKLDLTRRNLISMNNFSIMKSYDNFRESGPDRDSIIDVQYVLRPLPRYDLNFATDIHYSQLLNLGLSPSVSLTTRNVFGGAENLNTSFSGILGTVKDPKKEDAFLNAYELSAQASLTYPRLLVPFKNYWKLIPKRYSPTTSINLGASMQNNIGLGRIIFNTGLTYFANVNDIVKHTLTLFNTQLSLTRNKDSYYDYFPQENEIRQEVFQWYQDVHPDINTNNYSYDEISKTIINDQAFLNSLNAEQQDKINSFRQSLLNKDRQTQDVLISSIIYNFNYNEIGNNEFVNPFYFNAKFEVAGNVLGLLASKSDDRNLVGGDTKTIFGVPFSQFVKFDFDIRKYFTFFADRARPHTLALRQFIGIGIPYGNSTTMPFIRSYFNGGSNDIRAWIAFGGLGPADSQLDSRVRSYAMDNVKLTTSIEYRFPFSEMFEGALFTDAGNIWGLKDNGFGDEFKFKKFIKQMGVGSGFGIRMNVAYVKIRVDLAYKVYNPNLPEGQRWVLFKNKIWEPTFNFGFQYPF